MLTPEINSDEQKENSKESFRRGLEKIIKPQDLDVLKNNCPTDLDKPLDQTADNLK